MLPRATEGTAGPPDALGSPTAGAAPVDGAPETPTRDDELSAYHDMLLVRRFEEKAGQLYSLGVIGGYCHLGIGQEAVVVGIAKALKAGDQVIATHRSHGQMLAAGIAPQALMAEFAGKGIGASRGKGGSMHVFAKDKGFFGGHGIVGATGPLGAGIAFANRYRGNGAVTVSYMGDSAVHQGQVAEAFELSALWKLPVVFVIENNTATEAVDVSVGETGGLAARGAPYGIPGVRVDGMDVAAVREATRRAVAHARAGHGPYILEMLTVRYRGHSMQDPAKYGNRGGEAATPRERIDPLERARVRLIASGLIGDEDLKAVDRQVRALINSAAQAAREASEPDPTELLRDVVLPN